MLQVHYIEKIYDDIKHNFTCWNKISLLMFIHQKIKLQKSTDLKLILCLCCVYK
jgi:hypothetical protein